jgi:hypothetical protein
MFRADNPLCILLQIGWTTLLYVSDHGDSHWHQQPHFLDSWQRANLQQQYSPQTSATTEQETLYNIEIHPACT